VTFPQWCTDRQLFNLLRNWVVRSPSSVIRDPMYGTYPAASVVHSEWVCDTLCRRSVLVLSTSMSRLYSRLTRSYSDPPTAHNATHFAIMLRTSASIVNRWLKKVKVKFSHTRYRALGPELISVYRQSARRWREVNHAIYSAIVCAAACFLPGLRLPPVAFTRWRYL